MHVVHLAGLVQPLLGVEDDVAAVTVKHLEQDLTRTLPIAVEGEAHPDLVPDIPEALIIVGLRHGEDAAVGDVDDAACALLGVNAVADLEDGELEEADVDDVAAVVANLHAVAHGEGLANDDEEPSGHVLQEVFEGDGDAGREESEVGADVSEGVDPDQRHEEEEAGWRGV